MVLLRAVAGDERPPPWAVGPWPADLGLGAVDAQFDAVGGGVGEHVRQGAQPHARCVGDGEATVGQQRPDLVHRAGDGGPDDPIQHGQRLVGQLEPQVDQGAQHAVAEGQAVVGSSPGGALAWVAAALLQGAFVRGGPWVGQLHDQVGEVLPGQPREDRMGQPRPGPCVRGRRRTLTAWSFRAHARPATNRAVPLAAWRVGWGG